MADRDHDESRLDETLEAVRRRRAQGTTSLEATRDRVLTAARAQARAAANDVTERSGRTRVPRRALPVLAAAAAVLLIAAIVPLATSWWNSDEAPPARPGESSAATLLDRAAHHFARQPDAPPDGYRSVTAIGWSVDREEHGVFYGSGYREQRWVQEATGKCALRQDEFGERKLPGEFDAPASSTIHPDPINLLPCRKFNVDPPSGPSSVHEAVAEGDAATAITETYTTLLHGMLSPREQAELFRALATLPGLQVTQRDLRFAGRTAVALGVPGVELILDPKTGDYLGSRTRTDMEDAPPHGHRDRGKPSWQLHALSFTTVDRLPPQGG